MRHVKHACLLFAALAIAAFAVSCTTLPLLPVRNVSVDQLKKIIDEKEVLVLVDTRTEYEYRKGRIPGAVSIPPEKFDVLATLLPEDKNVHIIFYCRGTGCEPSKQAAVAARDLGYRNVDVFLRGYPAWVAKGYRTESSK
jgi:rhodanese-related sulfurtransferase